MIEDLRIRAARYLRIHDGDTFWAAVDLLPGLSIKLPLEVRIRVQAYNAAELKEEEGPAMREYFRVKLEAAKKIHVRLGRFSYDRIVCIVYLDGVPFAGMLKRKLSSLRRAARRAKAQ